MATGKVKWFNESKGFGFIVQAEGGPDVFVHSSQLPSRDPLPEGQNVSFDIVEGPKGLEARNVRVV